MADMKGEPFVTLKIKTQKDGKFLPYDASLSVRGICIMSDEEIPPGEIVEMEIYPSSQEKKISLSGRIDWCFPVNINDVKKFILSVSFSPEIKNQEKIFIGYIWRKTLDEILCQDSQFQEVDRRLFPRICRRFLIKFKPKVDVENLTWQVSIIKNISVGGCYFYSAVPYNKGKILELAIQLPLSRCPIYTCGEVKRCEKLSQSDELPIFGIAVQFLELSSQDRKVLDSTVKYFLKTQSS